MPLILFQAILLIGALVTTFKEGSMSIELDRRRLISRDVFAMLIDNFLTDESKRELEIICPEPGTTIGTDAVVKDLDGISPEKMYSRIYTIALRGHWLRNEIWIHKHGRSVFLYKYDPQKGRRE